MNEIKDNHLMLLIVALVAFAVSLLLNKGYEMLGFEKLAIAVVVILAVVISNTMIVARSISNASKRSVNQLADRILETQKSLEGQILGKLTSLDEKLSLLELNDNSDGANLALKTDEAMAKLEHEIDAREILLLSPDLRNDTGESKFVVTVLKHNIDRDIKYIYVVPNTTTIRARVADLKETFKIKPHLLRVICLGEKAFYSLTHHHIAMYDPKVRNRRVFMELPTDKGGIWIEMSQEKASFVYTQVQEAVAKLSQQL